jgi:hypothetical protein
VDKSKWRLRSGGPPLFTSRAFLYWLSVLPDAVNVGSLVMTAGVWPDWRERAVSGELAGLQIELTDASNDVWYPADGMAYVRAALRQSEVDGARGMYSDGDVITVILDDDEWRVHSIGEMVSPASLEQIAYSW